MVVGDKWACEGEEDALLATAAECSARGRASVASSVAAIEIVYTKRKARAEAKKKIKRYCSKHVEVRKTNGVPLTQCDYPHRYVEQAKVCCAKCMCMCVTAQMKGEKKKRTNNVARFM